MTAVMDRVERSADGCLIWQGALNSRGYGCVSRGGVRYLTHRLAYMEHVGPIPAGLVIDHLCEVKACCNPEHLEAVTDAENKRRSRGCGHGFALYRTPREYGGRWCDDCDAARTQELQRRRDLIAAMRREAAVPPPAPEPWPWPADAPVTWEMKVEALNRLGELLVPEIAR